MIDNLDWLHRDVQQNRELLEKENSQLARRNYLRSLIAFYETALSNLREIVAKLLVDEFELSEEWRLYELYPLLDDMPKLSDNGRLRLGPNRQPFLSLLAYTLKTYASKIDYSKDVLGDNRWQAFRETVTIRHRITHPKLKTDIDITDDELKQIDEGLQWWNDILKDLRESHYQKMIMTNGV